MNEYKMANSPMGEAKVEVPTVLGEFSRKMEKEIAGLHSLADRIEQKLHKIQNTNFPTPTSDGISDRDIRGNDDLEYSLFQGLDSLERLNDKLTDSLNKLDRII